MDLQKRLEEMKLAITQTEAAYHGLIGRRDEIAYLLKLEEDAKAEAENGQAQAAEVVPCGEQCSAEAE